MSAHQVFMEIAKATMSMKLGFLHQPTLEPIEEWMQNHN